MPLTPLGWGVFTLIVPFVIWGAIKTWLLICAEVGPVLLHWIVK